MDMDFQKSSSSSKEDQMEMMVMNMMMQMDKFPEFCGPYGDDEMPELTGLHHDFSTGSTIFDAHQHASHSSIDHPSSLVSFMGSSSIQEPNASQSLVSNNSDRFRGSFNGELLSGASSSSEKRNSMAAMREMIFRIAAMQPIHIDPESVKPPKRRNVKISKDPQSVAARHRRERISERIRILQRLVPGGTKMDTASMLDEAIHYVKFLKTQVQSLERAAMNNRQMGLGFPTTDISNASNNNYGSLGKSNCQSRNAAKTFSSSHQMHV
ncbi:hypothetical protein C5167_016873 [Papaver somniferum]|uniref:BHLH domain-containing protein n=1 Tax=Papaver somniferum TaxID=3469 RepID=A0A4Y7IHT4_PAPSO|nr:transcription factor HEC1-like [Papaver somniferum]RZC48447.1 hypothetical protein C5167_016873 [Papaver somniferum]